MDFIPTLFHEILRFMTSCGGSITVAGQTFYITIWDVFLFGFIVSACIFVLKKFLDFD